jgi:hypothetical protein
MAVGKRRGKAGIPMAVGGAGLSPEAGVRAPQGRAGTPREAGRAALSPQVGGHEGLDKAAFPTEAKRAVAHGACGKAAIPAATGMPGGHGA